MSTPVVDAAPVAGSDRGQRRCAETRWWIAPLVTAVVLGGFVVYGLWVTFVNTDYYADPYLSPFYSPCIAANCEHPTVERRR